MTAAGAIGIGVLVHMLEGSMARFEVVRELCDDGVIQFEQTMGLAENLR